MMRMPDCLFHADWSCAPQKRWYAVAWKAGDDYYRIEAPAVVSSARLILERLWERLRPEGLAWVGFDFPIGLPLAYAEKIHCSDFLSFLGELASGRYPDFFCVAESPEQIHLMRPFYPAHPGGKRLSHLLHGLGFSSPASLYRRCDLKTPYRRSAAPLFWTMGAQQVGKAAIAGWNEVLVPALQNPDLPIAFWPFEGTLEVLSSPGRLVILETYPAEYAHHLLDDSLTSGRGRLGKRSPIWRRACAKPIMGWLERLGGVPTPELTHTIEDGFGERPEGEDALDALIGLLGMLAVVRGILPGASPSDLAVQKIEGWILGMPF